MTTTRLEPAELEKRAIARVAEVANTMGATLTEMGKVLHEDLAGSIPELRGDAMILGLLHASVESNVETFFHVVRYDIPAEEVTAPSAAVEYARRLAQRGISSNALLRAYRVGHQKVLNWALEEIAREEEDGQVAFAAAQILQSTAFVYVDRVSELVVAEYEIERERWLANRNTVRATMLASVLDGAEIDLTAGEQALGYRLRQNHLGVVLWTAERDVSTTELRRLEQALGTIAELVRGQGPALFIPQDRSLGWGWIPLGRGIPDVDIAAIAARIGEMVPSIRVALGTPAPAVSGFRSTHFEALRAHTVASIAEDRALPVTTFGDAGVRTAALLAGDLPLARDMVISALGGLAADTDNAERLRETLRCFLAEKGSFVATAEKVHLHKNTVKYRVDKAIEARGRAIDDDRFTLELALVASQWLGASVLTG